MQTPSRLLDENLAAMIPCNRDPENRRNLRAVILEKVISTESRLRSLYTQLNALTPVSLLPTELLARIFHLLRDSRDYDKDARLPLSVAVTHVCRHWREVALSDSSLWSALRNSAPRCSQKWLTEMLIRSKNAPLDIEVYEPHTNFLHSLTHHSSRISRLCLSSLEGSPGVQSLLETEAPVLEDLRMETAYHWPGQATGPIVAWHDPPVSTGGFRLFHQQSSKLRKIHLYNIRIPWVYFPKCTLTHLEITQSLDAEESHAAEIIRLGTLDDLINIIADSPCLERLTLKDCLAPVSSQPALVEPVIELPRLRQLDLSGPSSSVLRIFQSLHAPVLRVLDLVFVATNRAEVALWPTATSSILSRFHETGSVKVKTLRLEAFTDTRETKVSVKGRSPSVTPTIPSSPIDETFVCLEFQPDQQTQDVYHKAIWQEVCTVLHMAELEALYLSVYVPLTIEAPPWTQLFERCANVTKLYAQGAGAESILWSMQPRNPTLSVSSQDSHKSAPVLLFPKLTHLSLENLNLDYIHNTGDRIYELLVKLVQRRERCGAPLRELCISCELSDTDAESLETLGPKVRWGEDDDAY
ncbi:hypothetical protein BC834DRAFT_237067 [Gloeopeniophorella convolvens]|nr:hypothetical protein BC834DRAFT_237067 [Gloeopeniophorella convolvens]